jgi:hypothetical protein
MNRYNIVKIPQQYAHDSGYSAPESYPFATNSLYHWLWNHNAKAMDKDMHLLGETLTAGESEAKGSLAYRVFGNQLKEKRISLKHLTNLLYERALLHSQHLKDIRESIMDFQSRLLSAPHGYLIQPDRQKMHLEKIVCQLEKDKRNEEIAFWKDMTDIRKEMFQQALEYKSTSTRASLLESLEGDYG